MVRLASIAASALVLLGATSIVAARPANVSDFAICNNEAAGGAPAASPRAPEREGSVEAQPSPHVASKTPEAKPEPSAASSGMASGTDSTGKIVAGPRDPLLEGLAADRADDRAYQDSYRECMTRRGVTGRPTS